MGSNDVMEKIKVIQAELDQLKRSFTPDLRVANLYEFFKGIELTSVMPTISRFKAKRAKALPKLAKVQSKLKVYGKLSFEDLYFYFDFYNVNRNNCTIKTQFVFSSFHNIALFHLKPTVKPSGKRILLVHGYLEHTFNNYQLINLLVEQGHEVFAMDMPGHGLSSGDRFTIDNFHYYGDAVHAVLSQVGVVDFAIGHSTGCASIMDYLYRYGTEKIGASILAAPLVRTYMYQASNMTYNLSKKFIKEIPYLSYKYSNNANYLLFKSFADLHQTRKIPLSWFESQVKWNKEVVDCEPVDGVKITVLQGDCDHTVEWKYNLPVIKEKFIGAESIMIPGADHGLFNESEQYQQQVFDLMTQLITS